jgi:hypothetical protein
MRRTTILRFPQIVSRSGVAWPRDLCETRGKQSGNYQNVRMTRNMPTDSNQTFTRQRKISIIQVQQLRKWKATVINDFLYNCTRNEHFAYLKQVAKSNFPAVVFSDGR